MHFLSYMDPCEGRDPVISSISGFPPEPHLRGAMVYPRVGGGGNDISHHPRNRFEFRGTRSTI